MKVVNPLKIKSNLENLFRSLHKIFDYKNKWRRKNTET